MTHFSSLFYSQRSLKMLRTPISISCSLSSNIRHFLNIFDSCSQTPNLFKHVISLFQMLGTRIEEMLLQEQHSASLVNDESKQRQLLLEDEEEDFLDEGNTGCIVRSLIFN